MKKVLFIENWAFNGKPVTLPHDAMIAEQRRADSPGGGGHGYFPGGVYTYEKVFEAPEEWQEKTVLVEFEGVYKNATVSLNGQELYFHPYGYTGFTVELVGLNYGGENTLTVIADNSQLPNSRWYTGSGIYRPVWLHVCEPDGLRPESVQITTLSIDPAVVQVQAPIQAKIEILDGDNVIASDFGDHVEIIIPNAKLWSAEAPDLYTCRVSNGEDQLCESFGVRVIEWSPKGLFINGKETLLRGGCVHHDNGILGAATYAESEERRIRILKKNGFNAIRSSHNPASKALLDACDWLGMYVVDETFDMWYNRKNKYDYGCDFNDWWERDTTAMVERDRNHPSVILYSIGNEVAEPAEQKGIDVGKAQIELIHKLDSSRPVTCGVNLMIMGRAAKGNGIYQDGESKTPADSGKKEKGETKNASLAFNIMASFVGSGMNKGGNSKKVDQLTTPFLDALDIAGYNYASGRYPLEGKAHPNRVVFGSETFPQDIYKNWQMVKQYPYLVGDFMWTAWDYLGEVGLGAWGYTKDSKGFSKPYPWLLADTGAMDILGDPNGELFLAQAAWGKLIGPKIAVQPMNHDTKPAKMVWRGTNAIPSWSWQGCDSRKAIVEVYSDAPMVELFLNGKSLGKKKPKECRAIYKTKYQKGDLKAVAYNQAGARLGMDALYTAKGEIGISVKPEAETAKPGQIVYVDVSLTGENGVVECNADRKLTVNVSGGELLAFGSANPRTEERFDAGSYTTYYGKALAVVRAGSEDVKISVTDGVHTSEAVISVNK